MTSKSFFLKDIRKENYRQSLSPDEQASLDIFLQEMAHGAADGSMDGEWMSCGQGYYAHLHFLDSIKDKRERDLYLKRLREDINIRLVEDPDSYMVGRVRDFLDGD
jgi:hypothetical protein